MQAVWIALLNDAVGSLNTASPAHPGKWVSSPEVLADIDHYEYGLDRVVAPVFMIDASLPDVWLTHTSMSGVWERSQDDLQSDAVFEENLLEVVALDGQTASDAHVLLPTLASSNPPRR